MSASTETKAFGAFLSSSASVIYNNIEPGFWQCLECAVIILDVPNGGREVRIKHPHDIAAVASNPTSLRATTMPKECSLHKPIHQTSIEFTDKSLPMDNGELQSTMKDLLHRRDIIDNAIAALENVEQCQKDVLNAAELVQAQHTPLLEASKDRKARVAEYNVAAKSSKALLAEYETFPANQGLRFKDVYMEFGSQKISTSERTSALDLVNMVDAMLKAEATPQDLRGPAPKYREIVLNKADVQSKHICAANSDAVEKQAGQDLIEQHSKWITATRAWRKAQTK